MSGLDQNFQRGKHTPGVLGSLLGLLPPKDCNWLFLEMFMIYGLM